MTPNQRKNAFIALGEFLTQFATVPAIVSEAVRHNDAFFARMERTLAQMPSHNGWFTPDQVAFACRSWGESLTEANLDRWLASYELDPKQPKTVALILAGNIPLVGFHDVLSVLLSGHKALIKLSSNDKELLPLLAEYLIAVEPNFAGSIAFADGKLEGFDAVIATGSNNTSRYFEYYFRDKPAIIRKNRNSAALLTGNETKEELAALGEDIFRYFGLGCRNVSKLFVPKGYDFKDFFEAIFPYGEVIHYEKYANNYDYNKAVFLMSGFQLLDNGFLTLKEDTAYASPISSLFYERYDDLASVEKRLADDAEKIQCIVGRDYIPFGKTQKPELWDYADGIDTLAFLSAL